MLGVRGGRALPKIYAETVGKLIPSNAIRLNPARNLGIFTEQYMATITLLGSSSGRNAGDAALLSGIMDSIDSALGGRQRYEIPTIKPAFIANNYRNDVVPISMLPWHFSVKMLGLPTLQSILRSDLTLVFDAILFDRSLYNPLFNYLSTLRLLLPYARRRGKRFGCYNVSVGPIHTPAGGAMLRKVCQQMDFISVRDEASRAVLEELGVNTADTVVTADAALTVDCPTEERTRALVQGVGLNPDQETLAFNVSSYLDSWTSPGKRSMGKAKFVEIYSAAVRALAERTKAQILFVGTQHSDVPLTREIMERAQLKSPHALLSNQTLSHYEIKGIFRHVSLLYGMRLHAVILASSALTPVCALPHQPKVNHYLKTLSLEHVAMGFDSFSVEGITNHVSQMWANRHEIRAQLSRTIPAQQERSQIAAGLVRDVLSGSAKLGSTQLGSTQLGSTQLRSNQRSDARAQNAR